jgi:hypothetical protein
MSRLSEALAVRNGGGKQSLPRMERGDSVRVEVVKDWSRKMVKGTVYSGKLEVPPRRVRSGAVMLKVGKTWIPASPDYILVIVQGGN